MTHFEAESYDQLERQVLDALHRDPDHVCRPRGMEVRERLAVSLKLYDPRARLSLSPARAVNYGFAAGEFMWYLRGARDLASIAYYNRRMADFSDDGETLNSAYGARLGVADRDEMTSQWEAVVDTLTKDHDSRRAVMTIYSPRDLRRAVTTGTKDVPCTLSLQFFIREMRLHLQVCMRSNDAVWGLANDLFSFTLLQEVMLLHLRGRVGLDKLEMGTYVHHAASLHLYQRHFELAALVAAEATRPPAAARVPAIASLDDLATLAADEAALRAGRPATGGGYGGGAAWLFDRLLTHRLRRDSEVRWPRVGAPAAA